MRKEQTGRRRKVRTAVIAAVFAAALIICGISAWNIVAIVSEDASSDEITQTLRSYVHPVPPSASGGTPPAAAADGAGEPAAEAGVPAEAADTGALAVNFDGLHTLSGNITAWIDIPGTQISYPVMQGEDNSYYLTHSADGSPNRAGSIFLDTRSSADLSGRNTIIYGHRMNNGSMFGTLNRFADASYMKEHPYIYVYLPDLAAPFIYEIISSGLTDAGLDSPAYRLQFADETAYADWAAGISAGLTAADQILTLSTCTKGDETQRFIVQAKRIQ